MLTRPAVRGSIRVTALFTVAGLLLAVCGSDSDVGSGSDETASGGSSSSSAFPVTVATAFGDVTVE